MNGILFIAGVLACYRVARMLALEDGPSDLFATVRGRFDPQQATWVGRGLNCPLCIGFWVALVVAALIGAGSWQSFILLWLAVAGGQVVLHKVVEHA
jgi:hypothetical protein